MVHLEACRAVVYMLFTCINGFPFVYVAHHLPWDWEITVVGVGYREVPCTPFVSLAYRNFCHPEILLYHHSFSSASLTTGFPTEPWKMLLLTFCNGEGDYLILVLAFCLLGFLIQNSVLLHILWLLFSSLVA